MEQQSTTASTPPPPATTGAAPPTPSPRKPRMTARRWVILIVVCLAALILFYATLDHLTPHTSDAYLQAYVIQVAPQIDGRVTKVAVTDEATVKSGDLLFEIDARPFAYRVRQLEAELAQAQSQVKQLQLQYNAATQEVKATESQLDFNKQNFDKIDELYKEKDATYREWVQARDDYLESQATLEKVQAEQSVAQEAATAQIDDVHVLIRQAQSALNEAKFDLEQTKVYASVDGRISNLQLRSGSYVKEGDQVLTMIDTTQWWVVANFMENAVARMEPQQPAELSLATRPGRVYGGKVLNIGAGVAQGQGVPSGELPLVESPSYWVHQPQRLPVRLVFDDPAATGPLHVGASVKVTIYTSRGNPVNLIAMIWQRITSWLDFVY